MTHESDIFNHLLKFGSITSLEIANRYYITAPHGVIRDLRKRLGYDAITDEWQTKKKVVVQNNGKLKEVTVRYKRYFLQKFEGDAIC